MIDASEVEKALIGKLASDATLAGLLPNGVFYDVAPIGSTAFAIVSLSTSRGLDELDDGITFRSFVYLVKGVTLGTSGTTAAAADRRIQELIDRQPLALPAAAGASLMVARWVDRVRYSEIVANETWQHRGARYDVTVTPA